MATPLDRRRFLAHSAAGVGALAAGLSSGCGIVPGEPPVLRVEDERTLGGPEDTPGLFPADGKVPNVVLVRFGGGVRRRETIDFPDQTYCPFIRHELVGKHGVLFKDVDIASAPGINTSHGQGTLYLLTGQYRHYEDITRKPLSDRFVAEIPTLPEYLRKRYPDVREHQALIVNGEDRVSEEFYTFSNHHLFGVNYRSSVVSLYGYKTYLLRQQLAEGKLADKERAAKEKKLREMEARDYRVEEGRRPGKQSEEALERFWADWRRHYGDSGLVNPRGDRLLTALALRALKQLRPRFLMVNYQDPDYVHWGNPNFYYRSISVIDEGVRELWHAVQADEFYRDQTVFVVVPDCGRDNNRTMAVPFQHHFNTKTAHEIFAVVAGPKRYGITPTTTPNDTKHQQISVAATVGRLMGFRPTQADPDVLAL